MDGYALFCCRERRHVAARPYAAAAERDGSSTVAVRRHGESRRESRRESHALALSHAAGRKQPRRSR